MYCSSSIWELNWFEWLIDFYCPDSGIGVISSGIQPSTSTPRMSIVLVDTIVLILFWNITSLFWLWRKYRQKSTTIVCLTIFYFSSDCSVWMMCLHVFAVSITKWIYMDFEALTLMVWNLLLCLAVFTFFTCYKFVYIRTIIPGYTWYSSSYIFCRAVVICANIALNVFVFW